MLRGEELLERLKQLRGASRKELLRACGYVSRSGNGRERINCTAFYTALLDAHGISFRGKRSGVERRGRKCTYRASVHWNGNLIVGRAYLSMLDFRPGDQFEIKLSPSQIQLVLLELADD